MTIEEYRDKYFPEYGNVTFAKNISGKYSYYSLGSSGDKILLFSDGSIAIETYQKTYIIDQEMMANLNELIDADQKFKEWRKKNER